MNCALHKTLPLEYFCETCLDPICVECIKSNPHSNEFHEIRPIQQAVDTRKQAFAQYVEENINPLRQRVRQKLQEIKSMESKQVDKRNIILKDIMLQFEAIDQRTKEKAQKNILQYQTQIKYYQSYLNSLDDLAYTFDKTASDPYNMLILYQDFSNQLKSLELKEIKEKIDEFQIVGDLFDNVKKNSINKLPKEGDEPHDQKEQSFRRVESELNLPRQIMSTLHEVSKLDSLRERNDVLNHLIASSCENFQKQEKKCMSDASSKYKNQLHVFNQANEKILKLSKCNSCVFCGTTFTLDQANDQCNQNKSLKAALHEKYTHLDVLPEFRGTKRHYWVDSCLSSRNVPDHFSHSVLRLSHKKAFENSLNDLQIVQCCFRKYEIDNATVNTKSKTAKTASFMKVFEDADKQKKGILSKITFKYLLTKIFEMNSTHSDVLTELLGFKWMPVEKKKQPIEEGKVVEEEKIPEKLEPIDGVNYKLLPDLLENPLFPYEQWSKIENEIQKSKPIGPSSKAPKGTTTYMYGSGTKK